MYILSFKDFSAYVEEHISEFLPDLHKPIIKLHSVTKNNGMVMTALEILEEGSAVAPSIYLDKYYNRYRVEGEIDAVLSEVAEFFLAHCETDLIDFDAFIDFSQCRDDIVFRLVNMDWNATQLERCPHAKWQDLAVSFRWLAYEDDGGVVSAMISNDDIARWGIGLEELYQLAKINTERHFPMELLHMEDVILEANCISLKEQERIREQFARARENPDYIPMYVLTNNRRVNGASAILYDGALEFVAERLDSDFYILPSSIHEVIIIEDKELICSDQLREMVVDANYSVVDQQERLSDQVYKYDRQLAGVVVVH